MPSSCDADDQGSAWLVSGQVDEVVASGSMNLSWVEHHTFQDSCPYLQNMENTNHKLCNIGRNVH